MVAFVRPHEDQRGQGMLSGLIIDEEEDLSSSSANHNRFGSLLRAYRLIGYEPDRDYSYIEVNRALRQAHPQVVAEIIAGVARHGGSAVQEPDTDLLRVNGEFTLSIFLARCTATAATTRSRMVPEIVAGIELILETIRVHREERDERERQWKILQHRGQLAQTTERNRALADLQGLKWTQMKVADFTSDDLLLFRTRAEVLMASQFCDLPDRLRLPRCGVTLPAWLGISFADFVDPFAAERRFLDLRAAHIENKASPHYR